MIENTLSIIDKFINNFLLKYVDIMPVRLAKIVAFYYTDAKIRKLYLKRLGIIMGEKSFSNLGLYFTPNDDLSPCIFIGNNVSIAPNVTFVPNSEPNNSEYMLQIPYIKEFLIKKSANIVVEDDVWIGTGSVIMPNVTLKRGSIIGAGAVVLNDTEPYSIYAGVPAKKIRQLDIG